MKIYVTEGTHTITIPIPTALLFNKAGIALLARYAKINGLDQLSEPQTRRLLEELTRCTKALSPWELIKIKSGDGGEVVRIVM